MKHNTVGARNASDLLDRLKCAQLVVGVHDRDQHGPRPDGILDIRRIDHARRAHRDKGNGHAPLLQYLGRVQDGVVLNRRGNDVLSMRRVAIAAWSRLGNAKQRGIVAFRASAGKDYLVGASVD